MSTLSVGHPSRWLYVASAMLLSLLATRPVTAQQIWYDPHSGPQGAPDYMDLFRPGAPWQQAASHVQEFEIAGEVVSYSSDHDLTQIIEGLRRLNIGLVPGIGALSGSVIEGKRCGYHVEGYGARGGPLSDAMRIKRLGGVVQYFVMDEEVLLRTYL